MSKKSKPSKASKQTTQAAPEPVATSKRKLPWRRMAFIICALAVIVGAIWAMRTCSRNAYLHHVKDYKANAVLANRLTVMMLSEMQSQWLKAETDGLAQNADGKWCKCENPLDAVEWSRQSFEKKGAQKALEQLVANMQKEAPAAFDAPGAYKSEGEALQSADSLLTQLRDLLVDPGKDLMDFGTKVAECVGRFNDEMEKTDFNFFVSYDEIKTYYDQVLPLLNSTDLSNRLLSDAVVDGGHQLNALKYQRLGFQPLPDGKGVLYKVITEGSGAKPTASSQVKLNYEGKLMDGTVFDSSFKRGQSVTMQPQQTVKGFCKALVSMPVGSKWDIYIPYDQAYGSRSTNTIPANSDLLFTIEVLDIK